MKRFNTHVNINVEITETGYSAHCEVFKNESIYTTGETLDQLKLNLVESINFLLSEKSMCIEEQNLILNVNLTEFFEFYKIINARQFAQRIGMNPTLLSQYANGKKKPSKRQKLKILTGLKSISNEIASLNFNP